MKKKIVKYGIVFLLCFGLLFGVSSCSDSPLKEFCQTDEKVVQLEQQIEDTYALINSISTEVIKANVTVETTSYNTILHITTTKVTGQGSGVIFYENDTTYYVLTNQHVVYKDPSYSQQKFEITDYLGNLYTGTLIAGDTNYDLAIVSFKKNPSVLLTTIGFANTNPKVDDVVVAIGQPKGQNNTVTIGKVLGYSKVHLTDTPIEESNVQFEVIVHDAPINHGSSGGMLISTSKKIVGINFAGSESGEIQSLSIPLEKVKEFLTNQKFVFTEEENA